MKKSTADARSIGGDIDRRGNCVVFWGAWHVPELSAWEPRATIMRTDGDYGELRLTFDAADYRDSEQRAGTLARQRAFELIDSGRIEWGTAANTAAI